MSRKSDDNIDDLVGPLDEEENISSSPDGFGVRSAPAALASGGDMSNPLPLLEAPSAAPKWPSSSRWKRLEVLFVVSKFIVVVAWKVPNLERLIRNLNRPSLTVQVPN